MARTSSKNVGSYLCNRRDEKLAVGHTCIVEVNLGSFLFFFCKNIFKSDFSRSKFQTFFSVCNQVAKFFLLQLINFFTETGNSHANGG